MSQQADSTGVPTPALTKAVKQLLRPLVGLLIDNGITYGWLTRILKNIFVEVAVDEFGLDGNEPTDSRVSVLTGMHRKDIRRIRAEEKTDFDPPPSIFIGAQLVALWTTDDRFCNARGDPAPLPRLKADAGESAKGSFEELFSIVSKNVRPRAFLDEWIRVGALSVTDDDEVCLNVSAFIPTRGFDEKVYYLGKNLYDHLSAARCNVQKDDPPFLERSVYHDNLSAESVDELSRYGREKATELLVDIYEYGKTLQMTDGKSPSRAAKSTRRTNLGIYFYTEDEG